MEHLHMAIEGFGAKHEDLVKNPRFSLMSRLNPRLVFKPDKFVGFRCSGYIYIVDHTFQDHPVWMPWLDYPTLLSGISSQDT